MLVDLDSRGLEEGGRVAHDEEDAAIRPSTTDIHNERVYLPLASGSGAIRRWFGRIMRWYVQDFAVCVERLAEHVPARLSLSKRRGPRAALTAGGARFLQGCGALRLRI
jgi:hypothetical protein